MISAKALKRFVEGVAYGNSTIKYLLVSPKDKDPLVNKSGAIYLLQCGDHTCNHEYIGKPLGPLEKDSKSTLRKPPLYIITAITQAILPLNLTSNYREGGHGLARNIKNLYLLG